MHLFLRPAFLAVFIGVGIVGSTRSDELPTVSYRFVVDPIVIETEPPPALPIPEARLELLKSSLVREQLLGVQILAARAHAGLQLPAETTDELKNFRMSAKNPELRRAFISAAVGLKSAELVPLLREWADSDLLASSEIETNAAELDADHWCQRWRERLSNSRTLEPQLILAIQGLGRLGNRQDVESLRGLVERDLRSNVVLEACRALGKLQKDGLEVLARARIEGDEKLSSPERCVQAVSLVRQHTSESARQLLVDLASQIPDAGMPEALAALMEVEPDSAIQIARWRLSDRDANVRLACVRTLISASLAVDTPRLVEVLRDPIDSVRRASAERILQVARNQPESVIGLLEAELTGSSWESIEESILILTAIGRKQVIPQLVELLDHPQPDVYVTSAWSLRNLVTENADLEVILVKMEKLRAWMVDPKHGEPVAIDRMHELSHLIELMGEQRYAKATPTILNLIPKEAPYAIHARASAAWSLGKIYEDQPDAEVLDDLEGRMMDFMGMNPEKVWVRYATTIAVGRIGNRSSIGKLQSIPETEGTVPGKAKFWSLRKLGAEK